MTDTSAFVEKLEQTDVVLAALAAAPNQLNHEQKAAFHFPIKVALTTDEGLRKHAIVTPAVKGYGVYQLWSDEGTTLPPGSDSAPAPLVYFAAGAAFCLVSHLTVLALDRELEIRNIGVESELSFGYADGETSERGVCLGLNYLVDIDSDEPAERLGTLLSEAKGLCLAEAALAEPVAIQTVLSVKGSIINAEVATQSGKMHTRESIRDGAATVSGDGAHGEG